MHDRENSIRRMATERLGGLSGFARPLTVLASPAWRGIEADIWLAEGPGGQAIYKHYHDDISGYVDIPAAIAATEAAGRLGVGPEVLESRPEQGLVVLACLGEGWRAGGLQDVVDPAIRGAVIARKKAFQAGPTLSRDGDIVADIDHLHRLCTEAGANLPQNIAGFMDFAALAGQALAARGADRVASHRDGDTSNLMIGPGGEVRLLDFDLAANADPFEDLGCYLIEFFECEPEARAGFEEWHGRFDEGLYQRARTYGILDDLRWGLIGALMAASSPRRSLEFAKYAAWRFLRHGENAQRSAAADGLRRMS